MILTSSRIRVLPYKQGSRSAKALADALGGKVLKLENSKYVYDEGDFIINWGNSNSDVAAKYWVLANLFDGQAPLNHFNSIKPASNKLYFFSLMDGHDWLPKFWTNKDDINDEDFPIVCRTVLAGHSGEGIHIANDRSDLVDAPLYVKYIKKKEEYRVHFGKNYRLAPAVFPISVQRKAKRIDAEDVNWQVRNHANGFVYVRNDVDPPSCVIDSACEAFIQSGLDFGAVDVIYNEHQKRAYVLEINTAPGLEGQTVIDYAEFFKEFM